MVEEKKKMRLLLTGHNKGPMNMAIDESILVHVSKGKSLPTLRLYGWDPSCISIGYFQSMEEEIDIEKCKELGVDFVRRITGGGAVFHDNEVTYSVMAPREDFPDDILESYKDICNGIIKAMNDMEIEAEFAPLNDIVAGGKKISGNAQTRKLGCILQHGTILIDTDVKKMFSMLLVPDEKLKDKLIKNVEERLTSINQYLGKNHSFSEVKDALQKGFEECLDFELVLGELSDSEKDLAEKLFKDKYNTYEWKFKR